MKLTKKERKSMKTDRGTRNSCNWLPKLRSRNLQSSTEFVPNDGYTLRYNQLQRDDEFCPDKMKIDIKKVGNNPYANSRSLAVFKVT